MSALDALTEVAGGTKPDDNALLGTCRLEWRGGEAYGEEAVLDAFRRAPLDLRTGTALRTDGGMLWSDGHSALVADLINERLARLWRVGPGPAPAVERSVAVPFDTDLAQERHEVFWRPEDHPWLTAGNANAVEEIARRLATPTHETRRARCFVLRAFSSGETLGVLATTFELSSDLGRAPCFRMAAVLATSGEELLVREEIAPVEWVPRL